MLSRTAENLYWSARYIERADSIARILEVGYRISLIPNTQKGYSNEWEAILQSSGIKEEYLLRRGLILQDVLFKGVPGDSFVLAVGLYLMKIVEASLLIKALSFQGQTLIQPILSLFQEM